MLTKLKKKNINLLEKENKVRNQDLTRRATIVLRMLFLADIHLATEERGQHFAHYLQQLQGQYSHIYILGDLFDYWLGQKSETLPEFQPVLRALKQLTQNGTAIHFIHGNRDFLIDEGFEARYAVRIHSNFKVIDLPDFRILLTHGDLLCTSDHKYQFYRRIIRNPILKWIATHLPLKFTEKMALKLKKTSKKSIAGKQKRHISVNLNYVKQLLKQNDIVICGHIHEETEYQLQNNPKKRFFVLGGWEEFGSVIEYSQGQFRFLHPLWIQKSESALKN